MRRALSTRSSRNPQSISITILVQIKKQENILTIHVNLRVGAERKSRHKRGRSETNLSAVTMAEIPTSGPSAWRGKSCLKKNVKVSRTSSST